MNTTEGLSARGTLYGIELCGRLLKKRLHGSKDLFGRAICETKDPMGQKNHGSIKRLATDDGLAKCQSCAGTAQFYAQPLLVEMGQRCAGALRLASPLLLPLQIQ